MTIQELSYVVSFRGKSSSTPSLGLFIIQTVLTSRLRFMVHTHSGFIQKCFYLFYLPDSYLLSGYRYPAVFKEPYGQRMTTELSGSH